MCVFTYTVCMCVCVRVCARVCVCERERVCVCWWGVSEKKSHIWETPHHHREREGERERLGERERELKVQCKLFPLHKSDDNILITYKSARADRVSFCCCCCCLSTYFPSGTEVGTHTQRKGDPHSETEWQHHGVWVLQVAVPHPNPGPLHHLQASKHCMFPYKQTEHKSVPH